MNEQLSKTLKETRELLAYFNAKVYAFDPGVGAYLLNNPNAPTLDFSATEWSTRFLPILLANL